MAVQIALNPVKMTVNSNNWDISEYTLHSPKQDMIFRQTNLPDGVEYIFVKVRSFPEIQTVLFCSKLEVSFYPDGAYCHTSTELDQEAVDMIRDLMELPPEYLLTDTHTPGLLDMRKVEYRQRFVDALAATHLIDIAEKIFDEHLAHDIPCFKKNVIQPLKAEDFMILHQSGDLRRSKLNEDVHKFKTYFDHVQYEYHDVWQPDGAQEWKRLFQGTFVETDICMHTV
jgi:hypothetical protein